MFLLFASLSFAQKNDTLYMYNGDKLTGEIKGLSLGKLKFSTSKMSTLNVQWDGIARIITTKTYDIRSSQGHIYYGTIALTGKDGEVHITTATGSFDLEMKRIVEMTRIQSSFWGKLDGSVSVGLNYTKADEILTFNLAFDSKYRSKKMLSEFTGSSVITAQEDNITTRKQDVSLSFNRFIGQRSLIGTSIGAEQNSELGIDLRLLAELYAGYELLHTNSSILLPTTGLLVNREYSNGSTESTNNLEGLIQLSYQQFRYNDPELSINTSISYYPSFTVKNRHRVNYNLTLRYEVVNDLFLGITFYDQFDSKPPNSDTKSNDYGTNVSIGYSW